MSNPSSRTNDQMREEIRDMLESYRLPDTRFVIEIAEMWLADHPADGDEPITPKWVKEMYPREAEDQGIHLRSDGFDWIFWLDCDSLAGEQVIRSVTTRGDVRAFLRGMGIDKKGGE